MNGVRCGTYACKLPIAIPIRIPIPIPIRNPIPIPTPRVPSDSYNRERGRERERLPRTSNSDSDCECGCDCDSATAMGIPNRELSSVHGGHVCFGTVRWPLLGVNICEPPSLLPWLCVCAHKSNNNKQCWQGEEGASEHSLAGLARKIKTQWIVYLHRNCDPGANVRMCSCHRPISTWVFLSFSLSLPLLATVYRLFNCHTFSTYCAVCLNFHIWFGNILHILWQFPPALLSFALLKLISLVILFWQLRWLRICPDWHICLFIRVSLLSQIHKSQRGFTWRCLTKDRGLMSTPQR